MNALPALLLTVATVAAGQPDLATAQTAYARGNHAYRPPSRSPVSAADGSGPVAYLLAARSATDAARYGQASDALGRAETRLLNDAAAMSGRAPPNLQRALTDVKAARGSAAAGQRTPTIQAIDDALLALEVPPVASVAAPGAVTPIELLPPSARPTPLPVAASLPPPPSVLYRLEPGRWQLRGAESVWIAPQTVPQPVSVQPVLASREVWNGDRWVLVPEHFAGTEIAR